ncbi:hypothetical protein N8559_05525 [Gammaproteobacteria bacterium]|nr:hypothetical protein [Gammaproteobacteria bacterium]
MIDIQVKNILKSGADIIVFSAHPSLLAGSGVSGIVHKAAGPELEVFAKSLGPITPGQLVELRDRVRLVISTLLEHYIGKQCFIFRTAM